MTMTPNHAHHKTQWTPFCTSLIWRWEDRAYSIIRSSLLLFTFNITLGAQSGCAPTDPTSSSNVEMMNPSMSADSNDAGPVAEDLKDQDSEQDNVNDMLIEPPFMSSPYLLVGKGATEFIPIADGEVSTLHRGCQGAQHLWVSLRLPMHAPDAYGLELTLVDDSDALLAPPFTLEEEEWLAYEIPERADVGSEIIGLTLVIFDPMAVVGEVALVRTKVFIGDEVFESRVWVEVQWGADAC